MRSRLSQLFAEPLFLAECYWPGVSATHLASADRRTRETLDKINNSNGTAVQYAGSILIPTDELVFRLFVGGSVSLVEEVNLRAAIPVERVVGATIHDASY